VGLYIYPPDGHERFVATLSTVKGGGPDGVALDGAGNVYMTGSFYGSVNFDPGPGTFILQTAADGSDDIFVSELDTNGNFVAAADIVRGIYGINGNNYGRAIALDGSGNIYTTGGFRRTADFNPTGTYDLTSNGAQDVFVSQLTQVPSGGAAASSPDIGRNSAALLASSPLSLRHVGESSNPLLATAGGVTPQQTVFHPVVFYGGDSAPSPQPQWLDPGNAIRRPRTWSAGKRSAVEVLDRVFADIGTEPYSGVLTTELSAPGIG